MANERLIAETSSAKQFGQLEQDAIVQLMKDYIQPANGLSIMNEVTQEQLLSKYAEKPDVGIAIQRLELKKNQQTLVQDINTYFNPGVVNIILQKQASQAADELFDTIYYRHLESPSSGIQYRGRHILEFNQQEWEQRITYLRDYEPQLYVHAATVAGIVSATDFCWTAS